MNKTPIQWTDFTVNPFRFRNKATGKVGHFCEKISPGCKHCYSDKMQQGPYLSGLAFLAENANKGESFFDDAVLEKVLKRRKPARIFWCDMTDMFGRWFPDEWIDRCFAVMALTPHLTHQVLTKRADRLAGYGYPRRGVLPNVWLGVSVEDQQRADERIPLLLQTPAAVRFLSVEPLLGPVSFRWAKWHDYDATPISADGRQHRGHLDGLKGIDWVIVGGESGPGARPCDVACIRAIKDQCQAAGVACFVKQLGARPFEGARPLPFHAPCGAPEIENTIFLNDPKGGDMAEWPADLQVREMPA